MIPLRWSPGGSHPQRQKAHGGRQGREEGDGESVLHGDRVSVGEDDSSGDRWYDGLTQRKCT